MHGSRWRGLETEHRLDKDAEVAHPTGKPTERRLRVLQPERATAPVPDPTERCSWTRRSVSLQVTGLRASRNAATPGRTFEPYSNQPPAEMQTRRVHTLNGQ
jgi:hypothetical protein